MTCARKMTNASAALGFATLDETSLDKRQTHFECLSSSQVGGHFDILHFWHPTPGWCSGGPALTSPLNLPAVLPASCLLWCPLPLPFGTYPLGILRTMFSRAAKGREVEVPRATLQKMSETRECFIRSCSLLPMWERAGL